MTAGRILAAVIDRFAGVGLARTAIGIAILHVSIVCLVGGLAVQIGHREPFFGDWMVLQTPGADPLSELISPLERWDGLWYQHIAREGYVDLGSGAFFPLYPIASGLLARVLFGNAALALMIVSSAAYVMALVLLGRLAIFEATRFNEREAEASSHLDPMAVAVVAMLTLAAFPTGFFLVGPFTESLFLVFAIGAVLGARQHRFGLAAAAAALATLTRVQGVFLAAPIAWEALQASGVVGGGATFHLPDIARPNRWLHLERDRWVAVARGLLAAAVPLVALAAWYAVLGGILGPEAVGTAAQTPWGFQWTPPWTAIAMGLAYISGHLGQPMSLVEGLDVVALGGFTALAIIGRRLPVAHLLYVVPSIVLVSARVQWMMPLMSVSRYVVALFPLFLVLAVILLRRPRLALAWLAVSAVAQLVLVQWFARWGFVA